LTESDSLLGMNLVNALNGTGVAKEALLVELPEPLLPLPPDELLDEVPRDVPLSDVVALEEVPVLVLVLESSVELVPEVEDEESAELEFTLEAADVIVVLPADKADVEAVVEETPLFSEADSKDVVEAVVAAPAPDDEPAVFDAVTGTVPVVVA
jgi:hypothetical protein